jgi:hypothetical protein
MSSFINTLKKQFNIIKQRGPAIYNGIKKGLSIGRNIIDVSKNVIERLEHINPEAARKLQNITLSPTFQKIDNYSKIANEVLNNTPNIYTPINNIPPPKIDGFYQNAKNNIPRFRLDENGVMRDYGNPKNEIKRQII